MKWPGAVAHRHPGEPGRCYCVQMADEQYKVWVRSTWQAVERSTPPVTRPTD